MNSFENFIVKLTERLRNPLPGEDAQLIMGSGIRMKELKFLSISERSKKSGVMILLYPKANTIFSALILRPKYNGTHSGQVALPGGKYEKTDSDLIETALRETNEEIGVDSETISVIGQLTKLFIPPSDYIVYPTIGYVAVPPLFIPDEAEVKEIIEYPISLLLDKAIIKSKEFNIRDGVTFTAPYFDIDGQVVWGATAMMLSEFREIIKEPGYSQYL
jgi:8-oxo-dGTP pyrophosphatase MutT (NUDIX family)